MRKMVAKGLMMPLTASVLLNLPVTPASAGKSSDQNLQPRPACCASQNQEDKDKVSRAEVVGTVLSNKCQLSPDKEEVLTLYEVRVDESHEGKINATEIITVAVRGGLVMYKADETEVSESNQLDTSGTVEVEAPGESVPLQGVAATKHTPFDTTQLMENGIIYVLRLKMDPKWKAYKLMAAPERVN